MEFRFILEICLSLSSFFFYFWNANGIPCELLITHLIDSFSFDWLPYLVTIAPKYLCVFIRTLQKDMLRTYQAFESLKYKVFNQIFHWWFTTDDKTLKSFFRLRTKNVFKNIVKMKCHEFWCSYDYAPNILCVYFSLSNYFNRNFDVQTFFDSSHTSFSVFVFFIE